MIINKMAQKFSFVKIIFETYTPTNNYICALLFV
jgi:hypothetical protein